MENAHNALYDTQVTLDVFKAQLNRYETLGNEIESLAQFSKAGNMDWADFVGRLAKTKTGEIAYNFGKHKGKTVKEVGRK